MITRDNWTHCIYTHPSAELAVQLSTGADFVDGAVAELYFVTLKYEETEHGQWSFESFDQAASHMNEKYSDWNFVDLLQVRKKSEGSGCDSCQAH